ncbi:MAG: 4Fe-4S dicluster domain-containing protein [Deltaproteobacteria bacterium]|jgi:bidirectional [NiFe] hydrogenase diaphorase subunit|nr:4Fe-4S dicluster domain-containing protein [Deltaproteobacteria bacterium]
MATMINLTINGKKVQASEGMTVIEAAKNAGIFIPSLCYHEAFEPEGTCRLCIVEVSGPIRNSVRVSCIQEVKEGLVVETETERIKKHRTLILELLLGRSPYSKELLDLAARCGVVTSRFLTGEQDDCVRCGRCVRVCRDRIGAYALCWANRGYERKVTTDFERLSEYCIGCGSCAQVCPTGAIKMEDRGVERKIYTWGQVVARFKLERCKQCDKPFAPKKYLDWVRERAYKPMGLKLVDIICPECVRKAERPAPVESPLTGAPFQAW